MPCCPEHDGDVEVHELVDDLAHLDPLDLEQVRDQLPELFRRVEDQLQIPARLLPVPCEGLTRETLDPLQGGTDRVEGIDNELVLPPEDPGELVDASFVRAHEVRCSRVSVLCAMTARQESLS